MVIGLGHWSGGPPLWIWDGIEIIYNWRRPQVQKKKKITSAETWNDLLVLYILLIWKVFLGHPIINVGPIKTLRQKVKKTKEKKNHGAPNNLSTKCTLGLSCGHSCLLVWPAFWIFCDPESWYYPPHHGWKILPELPQKGRSYLWISPWHGCLF